MNKKIYTWYSDNLNKEMNIAVYGKYGYAILLFPSISDDYLENEKSGMINELKKHLDNGKFSIFSVGSVNFESWLNEERDAEEKSKIHHNYNLFIIEEVLPMIFGHCGGAIPIISTGAAIGGYHSANLYFRRPDLFYGVISISASYNLEHFTQGYFDENCYFNSPIHYLSNLSDKYWLSFLQNNHHKYLLSGTGNNEHPENIDHISEILRAKNIPHFKDYWGNEYEHNSTSWTEMLKYILNTKI